MEIIPDTPIHAMILTFFRQSMNDLCIYVCPYTTSAWEYFTVKLHKAKHYNHRIVLLKTYYMSSPWKTDLVRPGLSRFNTFS